MSRNDMDPMQERVQAYQEIVREYEQLDSQIDALIMKNGGASKNMSDADRDAYRELARRRRDLFNEMRALEREIFNSEDE